MAQLSHRWTGIDARDVYTFAAVLLTGSASRKRDGF